MALSVAIISEFNGKGIQRARQEFEQLEGAGAKAGFVIKKAMVPATAAIGALAAGAVDAVKAAIEDQKAQVMLAEQLKTTTAATQTQIAAVEDWISTQGRLLGVTDDQLRPAIAKLTRATKDVTRAQKLTSLAMDISAATGKDLDSVTTALTKAELGQFAALRKLGVPLGKNTQALMDMGKQQTAVTKAQQALNAALESGDKKEITKATERLADAQAKLNAVTVEGADFADDLAQVFKGAAATAAETTEGRFKRLKIAFDETKESIGASLIPVIEAGLPILQDFADWAQKNPNTFRNIAAAIGAIAAATVALNLAMAVNPYVAAAAGIVAMALAFEKLYTEVSKINKVGGLAARAFGFVFGGAAGKLGSMLKINDLIFDLVGVGGNTTGAGVGGLGGGRMAELKGVPGLADGGIVTGPTLALIGEAGPEAVIPLDRMGSMGGGTTVNINVNGGDPNAVVDALRRYMRQNGGVPIRISNAY